MIQIDDAGSGSLVGGTAIGVYRTIEKDFKCDVIPLELYNPENFKNKIYQTHVIQIVEDILEAWSVPNCEPIEVCQGYIFDALRQHLTMKGRSWKSVKIEGILQEKVESAFSDYAVFLGLPRDYILYTRYPFHFHKLLRWVYADYPYRSTLCKTGWKSWQRYKDLPLDTQEGEIQHSNYYCLKCGKKIRAQSPIKRLKYISNKENLIYLHRECP